MLSLWVHRSSVFLFYYLLIIPGFFLPTQNAPLLGGAGAGASVCAAYPEQEILFVAFGYLLCNQVEMESVFVLLRG